MATYAIGDIQGCFESLRALLKRLDFDPVRDTLWFAGDLVNRGPDSLGVLRFARDLGERSVVVLGNHDLHLLAVAAGAKTASKKDTLGAVLGAPDREPLLDWLAEKPLVHADTTLGYALVHAGFPPEWDVARALSLSAEVQAKASKRDFAFLRSMYGNEPPRWDDALTGNERLRLITNYLTRMRFCSADGTLDLDNKLGPEQAKPGFPPWYAHKHRRTASDRVLFGHWASLDGNANTPNVFALDTGCVWGRRLTALRLEDGRRFSVPAAETR